jgi:hypothetical protein
LLLQVKATSYQLKPDRLFIGEVSLKTKEKCINLQFKIEIDHFDPDATKVWLFHEEQTVIYVDKNTTESRYHSYLPIFRLLFEVGHECILEAALKLCTLYHFMDGCRSKSFLQQIPYPSWEFGNTITYKKRIYRNLQWWCVNDYELDQEDIQIFNQFADS